MVANGANGACNGAPCQRHGPQGHTVVAIIPAYNEERFIGSVVLKTLWFVDRVIVVDDGSSDETAALAEAAGAVVIRHIGNQGKGAALNTGFRRARELAHDVVVTLDGDGQHLPEQVARVIGPALRGEADIVVGSRYLEPYSDIPLCRMLGHRAFNLLTNVISGTGSTDSQSGFRAFSPKAVEAITFSSKGFSVESEMQFLAHDLGLQLNEVPITIRYPNKPKRSAISHGMMVLKGVVRLVGQHRPLLFFGLPGLLVLLSGMGSGTWVVHNYAATNRFPIGQVLVSLFLTMLGCLGLFAGVILHSVRGLFYHHIADTVHK